MKCNVCGQEFGDGAYCKHCNADRITASGNYSGGYNAPAAPKDKFVEGADATSSNDNIAKKSTEDMRAAFSTTVGNSYRDKFMVCYKCGNIIPSDSVFCPCCGIQLFVKCPKCGHRYSSQYKICNQCGSDRRQCIEQEINQINNELQSLSRAQLNETVYDPIDGLLVSRERRLRNKLQKLIDDKKLYIEQEIDLVKKELSNKDKLQEIVYDPEDFRLKTREKFLMKKLQKLVDGLKM